jgi:competence protein ComFB
MNNNAEKSASLKLSARQERIIENTLNEDKHHVYNVVEVLAYEAVADVMDRMDMCTCTQCTSDVLALTLNSLPQKYVTSDAGKQYIQLATYKKQFETDVEIALMKACMTVKSAPNHNV